MKTYLEKTIAPKHVLLGEIIKHTRMNNELKKELEEAKCEIKILSEALDELVCGNRIKNDPYELIDEE